MLPFFYLVGGLTAVFSRNAQRLGDMAANTIVTREHKAEIPDIEQIAPAKYNSLLSQPHLAARLRSLVTPESAALVEFPEESVENLTDEQYVRCVLRVIYGVR